MREKLIEALGLDAGAPDEEIVYAVSNLVRISRSPGAKLEKAVRDKVAAGLSREDALQVIKDQQADDEIRADRDEQAAQAAAEAAAKAAAVKAKAAKGNGTGTDAGAGTAAQTA